MLTFVATILLLLATAEHVHKCSGESVCTEGFIMDTYCINLGVLLDAKHIKTLENPAAHSVHCLVDVERCYESGFNLLLPNTAGSGPQFGVAVKFDSVGNSQTLSLVRNAGSCTKCSGSGKIVRGFRGTVFGQLDRSSTPALLKVTKVLVSPKNFNRSATEDGCPGGADDLKLTLVTESGSLVTPSIAHGSLMIISWGFFLPTGISAAHFLKHRPNALWFKMHRIVQMIGLVIAIISWVVALAKFNVFESKGDAYNHGAMGMTVMVIAVLQPINAFVRPHAPESGESRPFKRLLWEIVHKGCGYFCVLLAAGTILYGTTIIAKHNTAFQAAWGVTLAWILIFTLACIYDGYRFRKIDSYQKNSVGTRNMTFNMDSEKVNEKN